MASVCVALLFTYSIASTVAQLGGAAGPERSEQPKQETPDVVQARELYRDFVVHEVRLRPSENQFSTAPQVRFHIENRTDHVVSRAYFHFIYVTPGRIVPWHETELNYEIPGGLEPGERAKWRLNPGILSGWNGVAIRDGAKLFAEVVQLDGADGEPLAARDPYSKQEQIEFMERLKARV